MSQRANPLVQSNYSSFERALKLLPVFGALALFLATIEYLFPKPVPFMRIGLANIPILLAIDIFPFASLMLLVFIKVLGQGLVNGTFASYVFLFSLAGSFASALTMYGVRKAFGNHVSLIGTSVAGALVSNAIQSLLSILFIFGSGAWVIIPYFLGIGLAGSIVVGLAAQRFSRSSTWYAAVSKALSGGTDA